LTPTESKLAPLEHQTHARECDDKVTSALVLIDVDRAVYAAVFSNTRFVAVALAPPAIDAAASVTIGDPMPGCQRHRPPGMNCARPPSWWRSSSYREQCDGPPVALNCAVDETNKWVTCSDRSGMRVLLF
jgi:hypothetical protein